jgi:hypothetical protein
VEGLFLSVSTPDWPKTFPSEVSTAMLFSKACLRNEAASQTDDHVAALFFARQNHLRVLTALDPARKAFEATCEESRQWEGGTEAAEAAQSDARVAGVAKLGQTAEIYQKVPAAYWVFVLGVCVHLVISGELAPGDGARRPSTASRLLSPPSCSLPSCRLTSGRTRIEAADLPWPRPRTLEKLIVTLLIMIFELSRIAHASHGSVLWTRSVEHVFALVRGL